MKIFTLLLIMLFKFLSLQTFAGDNCNNLNSVSATIKKETATITGQINNTTFVGYMPTVENGQCSGSKSKAHCVIKDKKIVATSHYFYFIDHGDPSGKPVVSDPYDSFYLDYKDAENANCPNETPGND